MVGGLAVLTKLTTLSISLCEGEDTTPFYPERTHPGPSVQVFLPSLTDFHYRGHNKYLEDFLPNRHALK